MQASSSAAQVPPSTPGTKSTPADHEEEAEPEEAVIKPAPRFAKFERNNFKCSRCLKVPFFVSSLFSLFLEHHCQLLRQHMLDLTFCTEYPGCAVLQAKHDATVHYCCNSLSHVITIAVHCYSSLLLHCHALLSFHSAVYDSLAPSQD